MQLAPVSSELTRSITTETDKRLAVALYEPKLADMPEEDLKKVLKYIFMLVGIRGQNIPTGEEKQFLHLYIRKFYGTHTAGEVRLAFDMAIQNRLEVDPKTYENFSVEYFARIMNAFRRWALNEVRKLESQQGPPPPTPEHIAQIEREFADYKLVLAFEKRKQIDKLPSTMQKLREYAKRHAKGSNDTPGVS